MRRSFALALGSLTVGSIALALTAQGCNGSPLGVQDLCGWIADGCNCYRRFAAGAVNVTVERDEQGNIISSAGQPKCGIPLGDDNNPYDSATGAPITDETLKPTFGTFAEREKLDTCILQGNLGGQVVFDPPLDVTTFPPVGFAFKIVDGSGNTCGTGSYASTTSFSIGFPDPAGTGGGSSGTGGGGGAGGGTSEEAQCRGVDPNPSDDVPPPADPNKTPIPYGTFSMTAAEQEGLVTTVCPNDEVHKFNLYQLNKCDGSGEEAAYKALLPAAEVEADTGGVNREGYVRFRVFWPPTEADTNLSGLKPLAVEYFHCTIPAANVPCFDEALSDGETDVDCGGVCVKGCDDGKKCLVGSDCASKVCQAVEGVLMCVSPPCGDSVRTGIETCDDGNTMPGDGCSATCQVEPGFTCVGTGGTSCADINECATNADNCPEGTNCLNTPGSFTCECDAGFAWNGMECVAGCGNGDLQPPETCDDGNVADGDGCTKNCTKEPGFFCMGEGPDSCVDIDECATMMDTCLDTETCTNTIGSFTCTCDQDLTAVCGGVCISVAADDFNCGSCGTTCVPNQGCVTGKCCVLPADLLCGPNDTCVDSQTDEANCGSCGNACSPGGTCIAGECCNDPNTACGTQCVNLATNTNNCGSCGTSCGEGGACLSGNCCFAPSKVCNGACTDILTDEANCGDCTNACDGAQECLKGVCCDPTTNDTSCAGQCVNTQTSTAHCGTCGNACAMGQTCVAGNCQ